MCMSRCPTGATWILPLLGFRDGGRDHCYNHAAPELEIGRSCDHSIRRFFRNGDVNRLAGVNLSRDAHVVGNFGRKPHHFYSPPRVPKIKWPGLSFSSNLGGNHASSLSIDKGEVTVVVVLWLVFDFGAGTEMFNLYPYQLFDEYFINVGFTAFGWSKVTCAVLGGIWLYLHTGTRLIPWVKVILTTSHVFWQFDGSFCVFTGFLTYLTDPMTTCAEKNISHWHHHSCTLRNLQVIQVFERSLGCCGFSGN